MRDADMGAYLCAVFLVNGVMAVASCAVGSSKNKAGEGLLMGFLLGPLGLALTFILVAVTKPSYADELAKAEARLFNTKTLLEKRQTEYTRAKEKYQENRNAWLLAGGPVMGADDEIARVNAEIERLTQVFRQHRSSRRRMKRRVVKIAIVESFRRLIDSQPWYLVSTVAGGIGYCLTVIVLLALAHDVQRVLGFAIAGFLVTFFALSLCQFLPSEDSLRAARLEAANMERFHTDELVWRNQQLNEAMRLLEELHKINTLRADYDQASIDLEHCEQALASAKKLHLQAERALDQLANL